MELGEFFVFRSRLSWARQRLRPRQLVCREHGNQKRSGQNMILDGSGEEEAMFEAISRWHPPIHTQNNPGISQGLPVVHHLGAQSPAWCIGFPFKPDLVFGLTSAWAPPKN